MSLLENEKEEVNHPRPLHKLSSHVFTASDLGLHPMIFSNSHIFMKYEASDASSDDIPYKPSNNPQDTQYRPSESKLQNIEITQSTQFIENKLDDFNYNELVIPIFIIKSKIVGTTIGDYSGSFFGIVRPKLLTNYSKLPPTVRPIPEQVPDLHFIMELQKIGGANNPFPKFTYEGINIDSGADSDNNYLRCGIHKNSQVNIEEIVPRFKLKGLGLGEMCTFYVNRK